MEQVQNLEWDSFLRAFRWKQGEHLTLIGPTGRGKTTLALQLLPRRDYVVMFATKKRDPVISEAKKDGYRVTRNFTGDRDLEQRVILNPQLPKGAKSLPNQRKVFSDALYKAYDLGGWTIYMDEAQYICDDLRLEKECRLLWQQGRSLGVTMVAGLQRPVNIPLVAYSSATHLFFYQNKDKRDIDRMGGLSGVDTDLVRSTVPLLDFHQVLYVNTANGQLLTTTARI